MATPVQQRNLAIDYRKAYDAAQSPKTKIGDGELKNALNSITREGHNTLLHLAAGVGNLSFVQQLLRLDRGLVTKINAEGNTALHLAAQGGFSEVVKVLQLHEDYLLKQEGTSVNVCNKCNETALFRACESGDLDTVKQLFRADQLCKADLPTLRQRIVDDRTCLSTAINRGYSDLVNFMLGFPEAKDLIQEKYKDGDTALHLAVGRNDVYIIRKLKGIDPQLCYSVNDKNETPLCMAAKLGHLDAVKELINWGPDAVEIPDNNGMNVLHLAAQVSQVRIVDHLKEKVFLLDLVNKGTDPAGETDGISNICAGDTPLHIAARKKCFNMVNSLLCIKGINKFAVNKEGLTALDIVRENTEYHESDKIISALASYPSRRKPFMYSTPKVSAEKHEAAVKMVDKTFEDRRNAELVVAVLLATMSFTAAFTLPGSFVTEVDNKGDPGNNSGSPISPPIPLGLDNRLGSPILLELHSFKLFLIFDCMAFFLSLFVVLLWQMSTPITTGNKILFLCTTNLLVCATFAFTAYGFMAAMYAMLDRRAHELAWFILGACLIICACGNFTFFYMVAKFSVKKARFNHLNGLLPFLPERVGECVWTKLERWGLLGLFRGSKKKWLDIFYCNCYDETVKAEKK